MSHLRSLLAGVLLLVVVACGAPSTDRAGDNRPVTVAAAFYPLAWLAERLGGAAVQVTTLTPEGVKPLAATHDLGLARRAFPRTLALHRRLVDDGPSLAVLDAGGIELLYAA